DVLPEFTEPGDGPRGPATTLIGLAPARSTYAEVQAWIAKKGLSCKDTSPRALMADMRDKQVAKMREAEAKGDADGASGASWLYRVTEYDKQPGVRLACEDVALDKLGDRERPAHTGRLLLIFDSKALPLRHIAVQRHYQATEQAAARADFLATEAALTAALGKPTEVRTEVPAEGAEFVMLKPVRRDWKFADLQGKVSILRLNHGLSLFEEVGVPWPVRVGAAPTAVPAPAEATPAAPEKAAP
ncbi:MAG: hypothetical protein KC620_20865, partial [Myxococcales bacterium]|nr:hypothetical protein [Myxococcales bacterium]